MALISSDRLRFSCDPWKLVENVHVPGDAGTLETLFAVGNGHLGVRGAHSAPADAELAGTFINGFHEIWDIKHAENAYGFARTGQRIVYIPDANNFAAPAHYGIRTADYKLIHYYGAGLGVPGASERDFEAEWELYDLRKDPTEVRNVADDPGYAEIRAELEQKLAEYQHHYRDEPYTGPGTPHPEWGPHDAHMLERVGTYVQALRTSS